MRDLPQAVASLRLKESGQRWMRHIGSRVPPHCDSIPHSYSSSTGRTKAIVSSRAVTAACKTCAAGKIFHTASTACTTSLTNASTSTLPISDCVYSGPTPRNLSTCTGGIRQAFDTYTSDATIAAYGHIENWDTSLVTDMSYLFNEKESFNADLSHWKTSRVTNMEHSTYMFQNQYTYF